ncbi:hypothetical protein JYU14_00835 [Simkania negevensis]|uniref:Uncharacterized protein n=1 Tax=Simkania negevensis TaxID=83561 RepID=A0ABS3AQK8_9BACT|nr:hypothetical protein [Simkania negevensis]
MDSATSTPPLQKDNYPDASDDTSTKNHLSPDASGDTSADSHLFFDPALLSDEDSDTSQKAFGASVEHSIRDGSAISTTTLNWVRSGFHSASNEAQTNPMSKAARFFFDAAISYLPQQESVESDAESITWSKKLIDYFIQQAPQGAEKLFLYHIIITWFWLKQRDPTTFSSCHKELVDTLPPPPRPLPLLPSDNERLVDRDEFTQRVLDCVCERSVFDELLWQVFGGLAPFEQRHDGKFILLTNLLHDSMLQKCRENRRNAPEEKAFEFPAFADAFKEEELEKRLFESFLQQSFAEEEFTTRVKQFIVLVQAPQINTIPLHELCEEQNHPLTVAILFELILNKKSVQQQLLYIDALSKALQSAKREQIAALPLIMYHSANHLFAASNRFEATAHDEITSIARAWRRCLPNEYKSLIDRFFAFTQHEYKKNPKAGTSRSYWTYNTQQCQAQFLAGLFFITKNKNKELLLQLTKIGLAGLKSMGVSSEEIKVITSLIMKKEELELSDYTFLLDIFNSDPSILNEEELSSCLIKVFDKKIPDELRSKYIGLVYQWFSTIRSELLRHNLGALSAELAKKINNITPLITRIFTTDDSDEKKTLLFAEWNATTLLDPSNLERFSFEEIFKRITDLDVSELLHCKALATLLKYATLSTRRESSSSAADNGEKKEADEKSSLLRQEAEKKLANCTTLPKGLSPEEYFLLLDVAPKEGDSPYPIGWLDVCPINHSFPNTQSAAVEKLITTLLDLLEKENNAQHQLRYLNILNWAAKSIKPEQEKRVPLIILRSSKKLFLTLPNQLNQHDYQATIDVSKAWEEIISQLTIKPSIGLLFLSKHHPQAASKKSTDKKEAGGKSNTSYWEHERRRCETEYLVRYFCDTQGENEAMLSSLTKEGFLNLKSSNTPPNAIKIILSLVMKKNELGNSDYTFLLDAFKDPSQLLNKKELSACLTKTFDSNASNELQSKCRELFFTWLSTIFTKLSCPKPGAIPQEITQEMDLASPLVDRIFRMQKIDEKGRSLLIDWKAATLLTSSKSEEGFSEDLCERIAELDASKLLHCKAMASLLKRAPTPQPALRQKTKEKLTNCKPPSEGLSPEEYFLLIDTMVEEEEGSIPFAWLEICPNSQSLPNSYRPTVGKLITMLLKEIQKEKSAQRQSLYLTVLNHLQQFIEPEQAEELSLTMFDSVNQLFSNVTIPFKPKEYNEIKEISKQWKQIIHNPYKQLVDYLFGFEQKKKDPTSKKSELHWTRDKQQSEIQFFAKFISLTKKENKKIFSRLTKAGVAGLIKFGVTPEDIQTIAFLVMKTNSLEISDHIFLLDIFNSHLSLLNEKALLSYLIKAFNQKLSDEIRARQIKLFSTWLSTFYSQLLNHNLGFFSEDELTQKMNDASTIITRISHTRSLDDDTRRLFDDWERAQLLNPFYLQQYSSEKICQLITNLDISKPFHFRALAAVAKYLLPLQTTESLLSLPSQAACAQSTPPEANNNGEKREADKKEIVRQEITKKLTNIATLSEAISPEDYFLLINIALTDNNLPSLSTWLERSPKKQFISDDDKPVLNNLFTYVMTKVKTFSCSQEELNQIVKWLTFVAFPKTNKKENTGEFLYDLYHIAKCHQRFYVEEDTNLILATLLLTIVINQTNNGEGKPNEAVRTWLNREWDFFSCTFSTTLDDHPFTVEKLNAFIKIAKQVADLSSSSPTFFIFLFHAVVKIKLKLESSQGTLSQGYLASLSQSFGQLRKTLDAAFDSIRLRKDSTDFETIRSYKFLKKTDVRKAITDLISSGEEIWEPRFDCSVTCLFQMLYYQIREEIVYERIEPNEDLSLDPHFRKFVQALIRSFPKYRETESQDQWLNVGAVASFVRLASKLSQNKSHDDLLDSNLTPILQDLAIFFLQGYTQYIIGITKSNSIAALIEHPFFRMQYLFPIYYVHFVHLTLELTPVSNEKAVKISELFHSFNAAYVQFCIQTKRTLSNERNIVFKTKYESLMKTLDWMRTSLYPLIGKTIDRTLGQDAFVAFALKGIAATPADLESEKYSDLTHPLKQSIQSVKLFLSFLTDINKLRTLINKFKEQIKNYTPREKFFFFANFYHELNVWCHPQYMNTLFVKSYFENVDRNEFKSFLAREYRQLIIDFVEQQDPSAPKKVVADFVEQQDSSASKKVVAARLLNHFEEMLRYLGSHSILTDQSVDVFLPSFLDAYLYFLNNHLNSLRRQLLFPETTRHSQEIEQFTTTFSYVAALFYIADAKTNAEECREKAEELFKTIQSIIANASFIDHNRDHFTTLLLKVLIRNEKKDICVPSSMYQWYDHIRKELLYHCLPLESNLFLNNLKSLTPPKKDEAREQMLLDLCTNFDETRIKALGAYLEITVLDHDPSLKKRRDNFMEDFDITSAALIKQLEEKLAEGGSSSDGDDDDDG